MNRVIFHPEAEAELLAASEYYESRRRGLGLEFLSEVRRATKAIQDYSKLGHRFSRRLRRVLVIRFPYGLLYRVEPEHIYVVAVAHVRRRPGYWRSDRRD